LFFSFFPLSQFGEYTQKMVAAVLGLPLHRVTVNVRRVGGAYGGKITQTAWTDCASALAAVVLQQPVAMHNERGDDMTMVCVGLFGLIL
jgi:xanthine dehydrogenase large subunit